MAGGQQLRGKFISGISSCFLGSKQAFKSSRSVCLSEVTFAPLQLCELKKNTFVPDALFYVDILIKVIRAELP